MATPILSVAALTKSFGGLKAVDDCSFEVQQGTVFGIIGPNGAGKTTLFHVLTGFLRADSGAIRFNGQDIGGMKPHQIANLGIGRTFQVMIPYYEMSVIDTLNVSRNSKRIRERYAGKEAIYNKNYELLERLSLSDKTNVMVDELTQGELRLIDIGRALATEPDILFLDEPFSGLGAESSEMLIDLLLALRDDGVTIVIIEHRLRELMKIVSTVMAINFGRVLAKGTPKEIVSNQDVIEAYLGASGGTVGAITS